MTTISPVDATKAINSKGATYNAVKIKINEPQANISDKIKNSEEDNGNYNAVDIEVNKPTIDTEQKPHSHSIYDYPCAECAMTSDMAPIHPVIVPELPVYPVAYQTTGFINRELVVAPKLDETSEEPEYVYYEEVVSIPEPNITEPEKEEMKTSDVAFNGLNFKAEDTKKKIEIVPSVEIKPDVDIQKVVRNLSSDDFDVQALQMEEIARLASEGQTSLTPYIVVEVMNELINIVNKDSKSLPAPSEKQIETRQQIIINEIVKEQAREENKNIEEIGLPYDISEQDIIEAMQLTPMELAGRNKEYALYSIAILAKTYTDEIQKHSGNVVPLTDLPGITEIVNTIRHNSNSGVKIAAMEALVYLNRPEYNEEISTILEIASNDLNPYVANSAKMALESLE